jgi:hypothetical protein
VGQAGVTPNEIGCRLACQNRYFVLEYRFRRVDNGGMKTQTGRDRLVLLTIVTTIMFTAAGFAEEKASKVEIKDNFILVHPGTKLSKADAKALNDVLKTHNKSLYKIETYKDGKVTKTQGTLSDMYLDQTTVADLAQAKSSGQSERAIQLVAPAGPQMRSSPMPAGPQKPTSPMPAGPQKPSSPMPPGPQQPSSPMPAGPQMPSSPMPAGPQKPSSPMPAGPQMPSSPMPAGPQKPSSPMPAGPQRSAADQKAADELMERLKPILEKYTHK